MNLKASYLNRIFSALICNLKVIRHSKIVTATGVFQYIDQVVNQKDHIHNSLMNIFQKNKERKEIPVDISLMPCYKS